jgi:hypothetical protein
VAAHGRARIEQGQRAGDQRQQRLNLGQEAALIVQHPLNPV